MPVYIYIALLPTVTVRYVTVSTDALICEAVVGEGQRSLYVHVQQNEREVRYQYLLERYATLGGLR
jgi:hypothetical protein